VRTWNEITKGDIVFCYDKEHLVLALYESNDKQMCRLERIENSNIVLDVVIESCIKK
jgi:hypothetical protein